MWKLYVSIQFISILGLASCAAPSPTPIVVQETAVSPTTSPTITPAPQPTQTSETAVSPAEADPSQITPSPLGEATPHVAPQPGVPGGSAGKTADLIITLAVDDLAEQLETAPEKITVVSVDSREWPNSALGCPADGMEYMDVITSGFVIVLAAGEKQYIYHTNDRQTIILCTEQK